jgi:hypothetical protein
MYLAKKQRINKINSISNCFNDLLEDLHKKRSLNKQKKYCNNNIRLTRHDSPSAEKTSTNKYEGLSLDKIIHDQNFDKKYTQIMSALSLSPKKQANLASPDVKTPLLWDFRIKKDGSLGRDQSLKRLEDIKLRMVYNKDSEIPQEQKIYKNFLNLNTATFKQSNSSDFFKSTNNSESRTLYSSKNSFYSSANNFNNLNNNLNSNLNIDLQNNKLENLSFYSYKSFSSMQSKKNNFNSNKDLLSNLHLNSFGNYNLEKTRRVNFDDFNTIGENPYKINIYETHNQINSTRKKLNHKNSDLNISPKNIYSPNKDGLSYYSNKRIFDIDHLYNKPSNSKNFDLNADKIGIISSKNILDLNSKVEMPSGKSRINLSPKGNLGPKENLNILLKNSGNARNRISSGIKSNRQYTLKKIDNLLNNFTNKTDSFLNKPDGYKKLVI